MFVRWSKAFITLSCCCPFHGHIVIVFKWIILLQRISSGFGHVSGDSFCTSGVPLGWEGSIEHLFVHSVDMFHHFPLSLAGNNVCTFVTFLKRLLADDLANSWHSTWASVGLWDVCRYKPWCCNPRAYKSCFERCPGSCAAKGPPLFTTPFLTFGQTLQSI